MKISHPFLILGPILLTNVSKEVRYAEYSLTLIVEEGHLSLGMFEPELLSHFDSLCNFPSNVELVVKFC